jgi:2-dehydropantoate 2-reductase
MQRANDAIFAAPMSAPRTEFAILGAGAIGSILGAHLARAGHSVTMLVRERRAQQLRRDGLKIKGLAEIATPVQVLTDASQLRHADVLIVAMKTPGTAEALAPLGSADIGAAFSIQNGMWKNEALANAFGGDRVLGCLANTSGELLPSGEVLFTRNVNIYIGELPAGSSARAEGIARTIDTSGVRATAVPDVLAREWTKFVGWAGLMLMSITTRATTWRYLSDPDCALVMVRVTREVAGIAKAAGVTLTSEDTLLPLQGILSGSEDAGVQAVLQAGRDFERSAPNHRLSSLQDLEAGRPLEIEGTLGYAVRQARQLQQPVPLLDSLYHLAVAIDRTRANGR